MDLDFGPQSKVTLKYKVCADSEHSLEADVAENQGMSVQKAAAIVQGARARARCWPG